MLLLSKVTNLVNFYCRPALGLLVGSQPIRAQEQAEIMLSFSANYRPSPGPVPQPAPGSEPGSSPREF